MSLAKVSVFNYL